MAFVHLHNHSEYSMLDGATRVSDMVNRAVELGIADQLASYLDMPHLLPGPTAAAALAREFPELPAPLLQASSDLLSSLPIRISARPLQKTMSAYS